MWVSVFVVTMLLPPTPPTAIPQVARHSTNDALYVEQVDLGEEKPRQIVSGLARFVPEDKMASRGM